MEANEIKERVAEETFEEMVGRLFKKMGTQVLDCLHAAVGMTGETGELLNAMLNADMENIPEELGDGRFYMTALMNMFDWTPESFEDVVYVQARGHVFNFIIASSEVQDIIKKAWVYGKVIDLEKLFDWTAQAFKAYEGVCLEHGFTDEDIKYKNQWKLTLSPTARYPLGYSDAAAIARADKAAEEKVEASPFKHLVSPS